MLFTFYSPQFYLDLSHTISELKKQKVKPVAAFDADGTLWNVDIGETFFEYQIKNQLVPLPENPWDYYHELKAQNNDPRKAYLWLAQICDHLPLETIHNWAEKAVTELGPPEHWIFKEQQQLIQFLHSQEVAVYIVSASIKWAIEPAALILGIPRENVLGVETTGPITYRQGKVDKLLLHTQNQNPFLAAGNTLGDQYLLEAATHLSIAVRGAPPKSPLFIAEDELQSLAQNKNWLQLHL